ncbi:hypothetical protein [Brevibacterium sp. K72]|uniref:hypothetical protein n=1 Tax=Brevibacterium sp. K72 TaxID=3390729 RepID=UPI003D300F52
MTDTRIESWLAKRRSIHAAATEESDGKEWFAARYTLVAGDDSGDPDEIIGDIRRRQYATAIADAHNHLPAFVAVVGMVLDRHRPDALYQTADQCENDDEEHQDSRHWEAEDGTLLCEDLPAGITQCRTCRYDDGEPEDYPCAELRAIEAVIGDGE